MSVNDWCNSLHTKGPRWCNHCQAGGTGEQCWVCGGETKRTPWNEGVMVGTPYKHDPDANDPLDRIIPDIEESRVTPT